MSDDENDIHIEESDEEGLEGTAEDKLKSLRAKLQMAEAEKSANLIGWQRSKADFVNLQRRLEDDRLMLLALGTERFVESLLPVLDSLESALQSAPLDEQWTKGFTNVSLLLKKTFSEYGVTEINETGVLEDPRIHESIQTTPANDIFTAHTVTSILQKGYKVGEKVIRAAKVIVAV